MALALVTFGFAVALAIAVVLLWRAYQRLDGLERDMSKLAHDLEHAHEELAGVLAEVSGSRILIEIVNPMTLARSRSRWGGALAGLAPRMIRRRVYDTVARELKQQLGAQGVEAHLDIFHPTGS